MTKQDRINYIDKNTYYKLIGEEDEESYINFLNNNPNFVDIDKHNTRKTIFDSNISSIENKKAIENNQKIDDYRYGPYLIWLELYLPRFETVYGKFNYSNENITMKQKCEELLNYYANRCNIENIEEIKKKPHKGRR